MVDAQQAVQIALQARGSNPNLRTQTSIPRFDFCEKEERKREQKKRRGEKTRKEEENEKRGEKKIEI